MLEILFFGDIALRILVGGEGQNKGNYFDNSKKSFLIRVSKTPLYGVSIRNANEGRMASSNLNRSSKNTATYSLKESHAT